MAAQVLITHEERPRHQSSGLRRNRSSGSLIAFDKRKAPAIHISPQPVSRDLISHGAKAEPSPRSQRLRKRPPRPTLNTSKHAPSSSILRRSNSESAISEPPKPKKADYTIDSNAIPLALDREQTHAPPSSPLSRSPPASQHDQPATTSQTGWLVSEDDLAVKEEPNSRVDYLSHQWTVEELSSSWRYIMKNRLVFGDLSRLENSAWRSWWKTMKNLKTLDPEKLNWFKDNDVTWLYGPLHASSGRAYSVTPSEPASQLSKTNSFLTKKSILKKRSMSEILLQKSLSNSSLLRQAATAAQLQQDRPKHLYRRQSDFTPATMTIKEVPRISVDYFSSSSTSGLQTPSDLEERKHISFAEQVEQCIAVDTKGLDEDDDDARSSVTYFDEDYSGDDGFLMMKKSRHRRHFPIARPKRRNSSPGKAKMIESLPATTLNDTPKIDEVHENASHSLQTHRAWEPRSRISPSPSIETIRPRNPAKNFLISEDDDFLDESENSSDAEHSGLDEEKMLQSAQEEAERQRGLRRTASGMLMPANGEEANDQAFGGFVGTILETVNTARDIAHVVWNVGWRR